jgi:hypothetical protein
MLRTIKISLFGVLALGVANAGTIVPVNLTTSSVGVCQGLTLPCTPSSYTTGSYMNKVFTSYVPNGETGGNGSPVASNSAQNVQTGTSTTPFILAAQSSPADNTFVSAPTAGNDVSVVVNLGGYSQGAGNTVANNTAGVFDIDAIYTMIQANMVTAGDTGLTVTLNGYDATGTTAESYTFTLTAGTDYRGSNSTSSVTSTDAGSGITPAASALDNSATACSGTGCGIVTYNSAFGGTKNATQYYLDVQELELPTAGNPFANGYLDSITITSNANVANNTSGAATVMFSALSLDQVTTTPEPSSVVLFSAGIVLAGLWLARRAKATA